MMSDYTQAIKQAEINVADARARGDDALGETWDELRKELFSPEENAASDLRAEMMLQIAHARRERGISQKAPNPSLIQSLKF